MFWRMIGGALFRQKSKMAMIAFTVALGTSLATAMLNVMMDVGDKVNRELKTYGANISVVPRSASLLSDLYGVEGGSGQYLQESTLGRIKTIFWAFNIVDFAPFLNISAIHPDSGHEIEVVGTWFNHHLELPTTEQFDTGMVSMKNWWRLDGQWPEDGRADQAVVGRVLASRLGLKPGDRMPLSQDGRTQFFTISGIFSA